MKTCLAPAACLALAACSFVAARAAEAPDPLPRRGYLGVGVGSPDSVTAARLGVEPGVGVWVNALAGRSPLREIGVGIHDVIAAIDDTATPDVDAFAATVSGLRGGQRVRVVVLRGGEPIELELEVPERPRETPRGLRVTYGSVSAPDGVRLRTLVTTSAQGAGANAAGVLIVQDLAGGSVEHGGYEPHRELAYALARGGHVAMRLERRGVGDSEGESYRDQSFDGVLSDLRAALDALVAREDVPASRMFVVAFGAGAIPAAELSLVADVAGAVYIGAPGRGWAEHFRRRIEVDAAIVAPGASPVPAMAGAESLVDRLPRDGAGRPMGRDAVFMRDLTARAAADVIAGTRCPVAVAVPGADPVTDHADADLIASAFARAGRDTPALLALERTDAMLARAESAEASVEQRAFGLFAFSQDAAAVIVRWLDARTREVAER